MLSAKHNTIVITNYYALPHYLFDRGYIDDKTPVIANAVREDIEGKHVIGVLPLQLAVYAESITVFRFQPPKGWNKGKNWENIATVEDFYEYTRKPITYKVTRAEVPFDN